MVVVHSLYRVAGKITVDEAEVETEVLDRIVEMASSAPMAIPPWDVGCVVLNGQSKVKELADELIQGYEKFLKLFKPWLLLLLRSFVGKAAYEQFKYFIVPLEKVVCRFTS